jgi:hypothetical protein
VDGGWGWFVVLGAFFISLICDGCAFSFGVIFVYLVEEFQESKSETAWVASIFYCLSLLLGPVASALSSRFGCRSITIVAGITSCLGFVASSYVTSVWQLYITFGCIVGGSFSICYVTSVLTVAYYFDKRRSLATGLSVCGTGIGTFTFAPLIELLSDLYGWRGAMMLLGAICLNICVCGALFRPLTFTPEQRLKNHLNAFNRLVRPVSRLSLPSRNRSRMVSTNSDTSDSETSESEEDLLVAACYSQIALPTFVDADKELIRMYLEKLPELRKSQMDPQLALQRFFKSKDTASIGKSPAPIRDKTSNAKRKVSTPSVEFIREDNGDVADGEFDSHSEADVKKKRKKLSKRNTEKDAKGALSDKSMKELTKMLLESAAGHLHTTAMSDQELREQCQQKNGTLSLSDKSVPRSTEPILKDSMHIFNKSPHHHRHHNHNLKHKPLNGLSLEMEIEVPECPLERSQSEKTPSKLQCKTDLCLERAASEKLPAKLKCQVIDSKKLMEPAKPSQSHSYPAKTQTQRKSANAGKVESFRPHRVSQEQQHGNERSRKVTATAMENSATDLGMMLMKKHSTYLILHRNDIFFRGSR